MSSSALNNLSKDWRFRSISAYCVYNNNCLFVPIAYVGKILGLTKLEIMEHSDFFKNGQEIVRYLTRWQSLVREHGEQARNNIENIEYIPITYVYSLVLWHNDIHANDKPVTEVLTPVPVEKKSLLEQFLSWLFE